MFWLLIVGVRPLEGCMVFASYTSNTHTYTNEYTGGHILDPRGVSYRHSLVKGDLEISGAQFR